MKKILIVCFLCCAYLSSVGQDLDEHVSVKEMIRNYYKPKSVDWDSYHIFDIGSGGVSGIVMAKEPLLPKVSGIDSKDFQAYFLMIRPKQSQGLTLGSKLYLKKINIGENKEQYEKELIKQYGEEKNGIPASWISGEIIATLDPNDLFGEKVSRIEHILTVEDGIVLSQRVPAFKKIKFDGLKIERSKIEPTVYDISGGRWTTSSLYSLSELYYFVNNEFPKDDFLIDNAVFWILLSANKEGKTSCHLLEPKKVKDKEQKALFNGLNRRINELPLWSFVWLYTVEGRIFSGRYIRATYSSEKGWSFEDYLRLPPDKGMQSPY